MRFGRKSLDLDPQDIRRLAIALAHSVEPGCTPETIGEATEIVAFSSSASPRDEAVMSTLMAAAGDQA